VVFAPEEMLSHALISTVSGYSEAVYGQKCGQKMHQKEEVAMQMRMYMLSIYLGECSYVSNVL
jgi:hypothetical protein